MNRRIREVRDYFGLTRSKFGEKIGVSQDVINNAERGRVEISGLFITCLCRTYGVNELWLRTGEGEMFEHDSDELISKIADQYDLSPSARALLEAYLEMPDAMRQSVVEYVQMAADRLAEAKRAEFYENATKLIESEKPSDESDGELQEEV